MAAATSAGAVATWLRRTWNESPLSDDESHLERQLGWVRLIGGIAILLSAWQNPSEVPGWISGMLLASGLLLVVAGAVTLLVVPRMARRRRAYEALSLLDAVTIAMLLPFGVVQDSPYLFFVLTVSALVGGVRLGRLGVLRNLVIAAPFETLRLVIGQSLYGNQAVEDTVVGLLLATGLGVLVADVAASGRRARRLAADERDAAHRDAVHARRLAWEVEVLEDVVRQAGTGSGQRALERALARVHHHLAVAVVQVLSVGPGDALVVAATSGDDPPVGTMIELLPGGPRDRAISLGTVAAATHDDLEALAAARGRVRGSVVAAPLPLHGRLLGLLVCETDEGDLLHRRDAHLLGRMGRVLAPFLVAAGKEAGDGAGEDGQDVGPSGADTTAPTVLG
ncbi:hypothetical protein [Salsipaludibacter albus]|uniref:hypothetical protein n=1 Tax=Salsipaludibacter albus TaxID=2849650 RepID=UPI001EE3D66E|nr:hypothetical protein [Salsipaludibacter albus]MBY5164060.1 hypothetical protein [Salsipaludibacter albus]